MKIPNPLDIILISIQYYNNIMSLVDSTVKSDFQEAVIKD